MNHSYKGNAVVFENAYKVTEFSLLTGKMVLHVLSKRKGNKIQAVSVW